MKKNDLPILDNHMHLKENGKGIEAAKEFEKAGGSHIVLVNLPTWNYDVNLTNPEDFKIPFERCIQMKNKVEENTNLKAYSVLGVHPAELTKWKKTKKTLEEIFELMKEGINIAIEYIEEEKAIALGEVGRPHYSVDKKTWRLSNRLLRHSFNCAKEINCPVQLHTESMDKEKIHKLSEMAEETGIKKSNVIKHFSEPNIEVYEENEIMPSVLANKKTLKKSLEQSNRFLMETDYLDDSTRPGAVLGPKNVPKRTNWLLEQNIATKEDLFRVHKEIPEEIYGIKINR